MRLVSSLALNFVALWGILLGGNAALGQVPCGYQVAHIIQGPVHPQFGPPITTAIAISPNGEYVVGVYRWFGNGIWGWVYRTSSGAFTTMPVPPGIVQIWPEDVNDAGLAVGQMGGAGGTFGFVLDIETSQYVAQVPGAAAGVGAILTAINAKSVACGRRTISVNPTVENAMTWSAKGGVVDMGTMIGPNSGANDITDNGIVVGWTGEAQTTVGTLGFVWDGERITILPVIPNGVSSPALAANDAAQVLVHGRLTSQISSPRRAYLWERGTMIDLGMLSGSQSSVPHSINNSSIAVGECSGIPSNVGFVWHAGIMNPLASFISDDKDLHAFTPSKINDAGQMSGNAVTDDGLQHVGIVLLPVNRAPGDANCDQVVNVNDLLDVVGTWGPCQGCVTDFTGDETVNISDLLFVIQNWTTNADRRLS